MVEGGQTYRLHWDQIGRPVMATDATGTVVWAASYLPFGGIREVSIDTGALGQDIRFPGQWFQAETGLHQNWHRDYDPTTGRYLQADPLGLIDGPSVYGYARQNPLKFTDSSGTDAIPVVFPHYAPAIPNDWPSGGGSRPLPLGHAGVVIFDPQTGRTRYFEYGRYTALENGCGCGAVNSYPVPNLTMGANVTPTSESVTNLLQTLSQRSGGGGPVQGAIMTDVDYQTALEYAEGRERGNGDPSRGSYNFLSNNCSDFMLDVLRAGNGRVPPIPSLLPTQDMLFLQLMYQPVSYIP